MLTELDSGHVNPFTSFKTIKRNLLLAETKAGE
jgi:hypothetical protein